MVNACSTTQDSPEKIFNTVGLNVNKIPRSFERHFREIRLHKANGTLQVLAEDNSTMKAATCVVFIEYAYGKTFESDIRNIRNLSGNEDSQPVIDAGLELFEYADEIYKEDFPRIARMIDEGRAGAEIDSAIDELDMSKGVELDRKYNKVMDLLLPYADKHYVPYKGIEIP